MNIFENEQITQTIILKSDLKGEVVKNFPKKKKSSILKQEQETSTTTKIGKGV